MQRILAPLFIFIASTGGISHNKADLSRIVGGSDASYGEAPYMVSLQSAEFSFFVHFCGGAIYSPDYVLSSASCFRGKDTSNPSYMAVFGGEYSLDDNDGYEQWSFMLSVILHEDYDQYTYENDLSIIQVETPFVFDSYVNSIAIAAPGVVPIGPCTTFGWGDLEENGDPPEYLQKVSVPLVSDAACDQAHGDGEISENMICGNGDGSGICQGDEGGPMMCDDGSGPYLAGISFYRYGCATLGYPDIYVEISYFNDWILDNTP